MGKRYYCDYCDRSFKDAPGARKKHLISLQHVKLREEHYNSYKDPEKILEEESTKKPCMKFMKDGECMFGGSCKYSHYTPEMIQHLHAIIAAKAEMKKKTYNPNPEFIVKEFFEDTIDIEQIAETDFNIWPLPPALENRPDLPPSLWPISSKNFTSSNLPDWGWR